MDEFSLIVKNVTIDQFPIKVRPSMTILDVKHAIQKIIGISPKDQKILIFGRILPDLLTISKLKLKEKNSIFLSSTKITKLQKETYSNRRNSINNPPSDYIDYFAKKMKEKDFEFSHSFKDIDSLKEEYIILQNPYLKRELLKITDNMLNKMELRPSYYQKIKSINGTFDECYDEITNNFLPKRVYKTIIPKEPLKEPSTEPIHMNLFSSIFDIANNGYILEQIFNLAKMSFNNDSDDDDQNSQVKSSRSFDKLYDMGYFSCDDNDDDIGFYDEIPNEDNQYDCFYHDYSDEEEEEKNETQENFQKSIHKDMCKDSVQTSDK